MNKEKIIVALDVSTANEARETINMLREEVGAFKIGFQLFTAAGAELVKEIVKNGTKIFLDLKFHDIPNTVAQASIEAARLGVWMFNMHASGGGEMMRRAAEETREVCDKENLPVPIIIGVTVLTSSTDETLRQINVDTTAEKQVLKLALLAHKSGLDGVVASPNETALLRNEITYKNFRIVTPGVRPANQNSSYTSTDDQKRVMTPKEALAAGADYLVIGRPILQAENPVVAAKNIIAGIAD